MGSPHPTDQLGQAVSAPASPRSRPSSSRTDPEPQDAGLAIDSRAHELYGLFPLHCIVRFANSAAYQGSHLLHLLGRSTRVFLELIEALVASVLHTVSSVEFVLHPVCHRASEGVRLDRFELLHAHFFDELLHCFLNLQVCYADAEQQGQGHRTGGHPESYPILLYQHICKTTFVQQK